MNKEQVDLKSGCMIYCMSLNLLFAFHFILLPHDTTKVDAAKYYAAVNYIRTNQAVRENIKEMSFPDTSYNGTFSISKRIVFIDIGPFCMPGARFDAPCRLLNIPENEREYLVYKEKHGFAPFATTLFDSLSTDQNSGLIVYFSKSTNNYLSAIITTKKTDDGNLMGDTGYGKFIKLVFVYDDKNSLIKVYNTIIISR